jgi:hypothetical protein
MKNRRHPPETWPYRRHPIGPNDPMFGGHPYFERHIYIYREQIQFDVTSQSEVIIAARAQDSKTQTGLNNIATKYKAMFDRWIDKYVNLAKGRMAAFILEPFKTSKGNNLKQEDEIDIELQVPFSWDDTTFQPLVQAVHDYIVNGCIYELLSLIMPPKEFVTNQKRIDMEQSYADIKRYVCSVKPGWVRKPLQPF